jgi:hypothetical protein
VAAIVVEEEREREKERERETERKRERERERSSILLPDINLTSNNQTNSCGKAWEKFG